MLSLSCLSVPACGSSVPSSAGEPFSLSWREREGIPLQTIYSRTRAKSKPAALPVAIGVSDGAVVGKGLEGGDAWRLNLRLKQEPAIAGNLAVLTTVNEFVAIEALSGRAMWRLPNEGQPLFGIDDDGERTVLTFGRSPSRAWVINRAGEKVMEVQAPHLLGAPAIDGGYAFIPWRDQFVSVFDVVSGAEVGRLVFPRQVSQAVSSGDELYFGERALMHFDDSVAQGGATYGMWLTPEVSELPGTPEWFSRGSRVNTLPIRAAGFSRVVARPEKTELNRRGFATTYFRVAMGFDADTRALRWVLTAERPLIGAAAADGAYFFCSAMGRVLEIDAESGASRRVALLGKNLNACTVSAGDYRLEGAFGEPKSFEEHLTQALLLEDPQVVAAQGFLLEQTRYIDHPLVTKTLIEMLRAPKTSPALSNLASELLAKRTSGIEHMIAALERPYDYLAGEHTVPPVGPIARALAAQNQTSAAALLAEHLNQPHYDAASVLEMARALKLLATADQVSELSKFFLLTHATADSEPLAEASLLVAETLLNLGDRPAQVVIQQAAQSSMTHPSVKEKLRGMFDWNEKVASP